MKEIVIDIQNLNKSFTTKHLKTLALNNINLQVFEGDYLSITGVSGCGKSTLLSVLGLLSSWDSGSLTLANQTITTLSSSQKAQIRNKHFGFIFQSFNLVEHLNAWQNVALPLTIRGMNKQHAKQAAMQALESVNLSNRSLHSPSQLSGGQQQRVSIARAIVTKPDVIFADEPTGNLDSQSAKQISELLDNIHKQGNTIVLVTHDNELSKSTSRQLKMHDGKLQIK